MKGLTIMKENYLQPVSIKDVKLHGDFSWFDPTVTIIRAKNIRFEAQIPVTTCKAPEAFKKESGYDHSPELFIRSY